MISQVLTNGVLAGLTWSLVGLGFSIVFGTTRILHVAYASTLLVGAYVGLSLTHVPRIPLLFCAIGAVLSATILGLLIEILIYRHLRNLESHTTMLFLASLGLTVIVENCVALIWGSEIRIAAGSRLQTRVHLFGAELTEFQCGVAVIVLMVFLGISGITRFTLFGKKMRAISSDPELARTIGIDKNATILAAILLGSAISGLAGFLIAFDSSATPTMGFPILIIGVAVAIVGGVGSQPGALLGGLLVGMAQHLGAWVFSPVWQDGIAYLVLLLFLILRPQGFFGTPLRKVTI